jgi:hypothetical protein
MFRYFPTALAAKVHRAEGIIIIIIIIIIIKVTVYQLLRPCNVHLDTTGNELGCPTSSDQLSILPCSWQIYETTWNSINFEVIVVQFFLCFVSG